MAKRTTDAVLRGEIASAEKAVDAAGTLVLRRFAEMKKAEELLALARNEEINARERLRRSEASLAAFLGTGPGKLVDSTTREEAAG